MSEESAIPGWDPNTSTYSLAFPITIKSRIVGSSEAIERKIEQLTVRRMNGADIRAQDAFKGSDIAKGLFVMMRVTGGDQTVIDALDAADIAVLGDILESFQAGRKTGETS